VCTPYTAFIYNPLPNSGLCKWGLSICSKRLPGEPPYI
jgi:hypothetical protein